MRHSTWSCAWLYLSVCYWLVGLVTFPGAQDDDNLWHGDRSHTLGKASSYCYRVTSSEVSDKAPRVSGDVSGHSQQIPWTQDRGVAQKMRSRSRKHFILSPAPDSFTLALQGVMRHLPPKLVSPPLPCQPAPSLLQGLVGGVVSEVSGRAWEKMLSEPFCTYRLLGRMGFKPQHLWPLYPGSFLPVRS